MYVCFKCQSVLGSIDALCIHFKVAHVSESFDWYECCQPNCHSGNFKTWSDLRRHLRVTHPKSVQGPRAVLRHDSKMDCQFPDNQFESTCTGEDVHQESKQPPSVKDFTEEMHIFMLGFIGRLYANPNLPRSHVQVIVEETKSLLSMIHSVLLTTVLSALNSNGVPSDVVLKVQSTLNVVNTCLDSFSTEYRRLKMVSRSGDLIRPKSHVIGYTMADRKRDNHIVKEIVPMTCQFIPLRKLLLKFFSLPGVYSTCKSHMEELEKQTAVVSNFVQGKLWREKKRQHFPDKVVFPLFLYFDDLEVNNPLGSHKCVSKLGATFVTIPCIPPEFRSTLDNIFLALLFYTLDRSYYGNQAIFNVLVNEINFLQRFGITLNISDSPIQVYFSLGLILGDNLGLNGILGFAEGFTANYFCRFCKTHRDDTHWDTTARVDTLRKIEEYDDDVASPMEESGVKEASIWNSVDHFHVYQNYCSDPLLHELAEGSGKRAIREILYHYVKKEKSFDLDFLNQRIKTFDYRLSGLSNKPPLISEAELDDKKIHMSGSETLNFILIFGLLVGDKTPHDDVWRFYLILRQILEIVSAKSIQSGCSKQLKYLVSVYNSMYIQLFDQHLKAKEHIMTHWDEIMEMSGPLSNISTMRMEAKNRLFKLRANATSSRMNIVFTTAFKEQLQLCYRLASRRGFFNPFETGPAHSVNFDDDFNFDIADYENVPDSILKISVEVPWVNVKGTTYKVGMCVVLSYDDQDLPVFGEIQKIFCTEAQKVYFLCQKFVTLGFNEHFHSFEVCTSTQQVCISHDDLWSFLPVVQSFHSDGNHYVFTR